MKNVPTISSFKRRHYCKMCNCMYGTNATNSSICPACKPMYAVNYVMASRHEKHPEVMVGVGSGGNQKGESNHEYDEASFYHKYRINVKGYATSHYKEIAKRLWGSKCVFCGKCDCIHVHHINGVKTENCPHNIVPLCEHCHNLIHNAKHLSTEDLIQRFERQVPYSVSERLNLIRTLEDEDGVIPDHELSYIGALYIVQNNIPTDSIVSASRPNSKQDTLVTALKNCKCTCPVCGNYSNSRLILTFINGNRRCKTPENLTMLCKTCYNNIIEKYRTYDEFLR